MTKISNENNDKPILIMADPASFAIEKPYADGHAPANDFSVKGYEEYSRDPEAFVAKAKAQWTRLRDVFNQLGAQVVVMKAKPHQPDQVFTTDPFLSLKAADGKLITIFSRFSNEGRQQEVADLAAFLEKNAPGSVMLNAHFRTEGGDNVYDSFRDVFWSGYTKTPGRDGAASGRSDIRAHKALTQATGVEVVDIEVKEPFFHIDTAVAPLPDGHIVCYRGGMSDEAFEELQQKAFDRYGLDRDKYLIEVSKEDAAAYACNLRCIGKTIVMPVCSQELQDKLKGIGYKVITLDMSQFIMTGGAVHCLANNINETRVPGGTIRQQAAGKIVVENPVIR